MKHQTYKWTPYVFHVSHLSFVNFVSKNINRKAYIFFCFYIDKFDKKSFITDKWGEINS